MDSSKSTEDDTIRDSMESGYIATRPRFTRARDTFKVNVRNLVAEDKRALDAFVKTKSLRGANSFLYPNLLLNGSFEFPAVSASDLVFGWNLSAAAAGIIVEPISGTPVADGSWAVNFLMLGGNVFAPGAQKNAQLGCDQLIPCTPGDVYAFTASLNCTPANLPTGGPLGIPPGGLVGNVVISYFDSNGNPLSTYTSLPATVASVWSPYSFQFTIPANAVTFGVALSVTFKNPTSSAITLSAPAAIAFDNVGCALYTPVQPYGRTVGTDPLPWPVRFSSLPEFSDVGFGGGVKRYGVHFELTEV